ncbi:hypothetical protein [Levilactobacillus sp. HBUAS67488]|uniref:hypothetical protein n=1 Tax=Levilactobacillus sp. HBUAS67488 TaxID=3109361 RepID=UPI002FF30651
MAESALTGDRPNHGKQKERQRWPSLGWKFSSASIRRQTLLTALPFAKFGLERGGQDREKPKGCLFPRFEPSARVSKTPVSKQNHLETPTAETRFGSLTATRDVRN